MVMVSTVALAIGLSACGGGGGGGGIASLPQVGGENRVNSLALTGNAYLSADFGIGRIYGELTEMMAGGTLPWNSVSLLASISGGNYFSGTSAAMTAPGNSASLSGSATGTVAGMFFGPTARELGAVWTLSDGVGAATRTIGAKYDPWGY